MKFFSLAWLEMDDEELRRVPALYEAHLAAFGARLPPDAWRLQTDVSLHDGLLRSVSHEHGKLDVSFRAGDLRVGYFDARLSYQDVTISAADEQFLKESVDDPQVELLYDEFDAADSHWVHRCLYWVPPSRGSLDDRHHEVSVYFGTFSLSVTPARGRFDADEGNGGN